MIFEMKLDNLSKRRHDKIIFKQDFIFHVYETPINFYVSKI
eukprot:UN03275